MKIPPQRRCADPAIIALADEDALVSDLLRPHFCDLGEWLVLLSFAHDGRLVTASESGGARRGSAHLLPAMVRSALTMPTGSVLLLAHNHPSGDMRPSNQDIWLTRQLAALCRFAGLTLSDHLILSNRGHFSFRAAGLI